MPTGLVGRGLAGLLRGTWTVVLERWGPAHRPSRRRNLASWARRKPPRVRSTLSNSLALSPCYLNSRAAIHHVVYAYDPIALVAPKLPTAALKQFRAFHLQEVGRDVARNGIVTCQALP